MTESFLIVLSPDSDFREQHDGTLETATIRAKQWLREHNASPTAERNGEQVAARIIRWADHSTLTVGQIAQSDIATATVRQ